MSDTEEARLITSAPFLSGVIGQPLPSTGSGDGDENSSPDTSDAAGILRIHPAGTRVNLASIHSWCLVQVPEVVREPAGQIVQLTDGRQFVAGELVTVAGHPRPFLVAEIEPKVHPEVTLLPITQQKAYDLQQARGALDELSLLTVTERQVLLDQFPALIERPVWQACLMTKTFTFQTDERCSTRRSMFEVDDDWRVLIEDTESYGVAVSFTSTSGQADDELWLDEVELAEILQQVEWVKEGRAGL